MIDNRVRMIMSNRYKIHLLDVAYVALISLTSERSPLTSISSHLFAYATAKLKLQYPRRMQIN